MGLTVRAVGRATKRGIIPRLPAPDRLLEDAQAWLGLEHPEPVRAMRCEKLPTGESELAVDLHPAAEPFTLTIGEDARVVANGDTSAVGPGYHTFVGRIVDRLGEELGIDWTGEEPAAAAGSDLPHGPAGAGSTPVPGWAQAKTTAALTDRPAVERAHLAWLGHLLGRAREARRLGVNGLHLGTRPGTVYRFDGALATPLGPRDDAWLEQAAGDARVAIDVRPWWTDATDGRYLLNRALAIMWTEIRWRPPVEEERPVIDEALRLLRKAFPLDPSLPFPWREWHELIVLRDVDDPISRQVADRAGRQPASRAPIGYRRGTVSVMHEGWSLEVPGSFAERRSDEEWWGGEAGRSVTLAGVMTGADGGNPMRADSFLARVAGDLGENVITHRDGELAGKARLGTDATSGVEVGVLEGFSAVTGRGAAIRVVFDDPDDWQWAVNLWRALRPA